MWQKPKWNCDKKLNIQNLIKVENSYSGKNSENQIVTNSKTQIVPNSKTQIVKKVKISNCDKN